MIPWMLDLLQVQEGTNDVCGEERFMISTLFAKLLRYCEIASH